MNLDIYDEYDRWKINYIVYHKEHLRDYRDPMSANIHFSSKLYGLLDEIKAKTGADQINAVQSLMRAQAPNAASGLKILSDLQEGALLADTLNSVADTINAGIEYSGGTVDFNNYNDIIRQVKDFSGLLAQSPQIQQVNDFFNLLLDAMNRAKLLDPTVLDALSGIGQQLIGTDFAIDQNWTQLAQGVTSNDIEAAQKVINSLSNAANKMQTAGGVSSRSFAVTITNIFSSIIGEQIEKLIVAQGLSVADSKIEDLVDDLIRRSNGKMKRMTSRAQNYTNTINVNLFDRDVFQLKLRGISNTDFSIEIGNSSSIQWYKKRSSGINIRREESLKNYFEPGREKYLAYNMIAHRYTGSDFEESFQRIKSYTAASFFNDWISSGQMKTITGQKLQFIVVNGKLYPVSRIIANMCESLTRGNNSNTAFQMDIQTDKINKWVGGKYPSIGQAMFRSDIVNAIMNNFIIAGRLNSNILTQYAY